MIENKYQINTYTLHVLPDCKESREKLKEIVNKLDKELKLAFMHYIYWGNLYSPIRHYEDIVFENISLRPKHSKQTEEGGDEN